MPSLQTLNYTAAFLHFVQAIIVISLIANLNSKHANDPPLIKGIYTIQKNLYLLRDSDNLSPKCDLPLLINTSQSASDPYMSLNLYGGGLHLQINDTQRGYPQYMTLNLRDTSLHLQTNNYYRFMENSVAVPQNLEVGYLDLRYLIFAFFLLSSTFQAIEALWGNYSGPRLLRFVEYSFSSSVMILAIAIQVGLTDIYILVTLFTLMFTTNILGLMAELLCFLAETGTGSIYLWILPHGLAWVTCLVAYAPLLDAYLSSTRCSDRSPPGFVNVIIFLEFFMFISFGFVQIYSLVCKTVRFLNSADDGGAYRQVTRLQQMTIVSDPLFDYEFASKGDGPQHQQQQQLPSDDITAIADWAYVTLSFTAKTFLAWLILAPTFTSSSSST